MMRCVPPSLRSFAGRITGYPSDVLSLNPGARLAERLLARPSEEIMSIARGDWFDPHSASSVFDRHFDAVRTEDDVRQMMEADRSLWLVDESLKLCDAVTMASGLECRVPFVDARVAAWSHATKSDWHVEWRRTKALLKDTYRSLLPKHLYALDKASFYPPLAKWLRRECMPLMEETLQGKRIAEYFDVKQCRAVFEHHRTKQRYGLHQLSNIMQLHYWFETVYDTPPSR